MVIYIAHWDHRGRGQADRTGDGICNGAIDNASGVAALVALAKANAVAGPARRSLAFIAVTAEESGLLGSPYYGENPMSPPEKTVAGIYIDMLNFAGRSAEARPSTSMHSS